MHRPQPPDVHHLHSLPQGEPQRRPPRHAAQYLRQDHPVYRAGVLDILKADNDITSDVYVFQHLGHLFVLRRGWTLL